MQGAILEILLLHRGHFPLTLNRGVSHASIEDLSHLLARALCEEEGYERHLLAWWHHSLDEDDQHMLHHLGHDLKYDGGRILCQRLRALNPKQQIELFIANFEKMLALSRAHLPWEHLSTCAKIALNSSVRCM